MPVQEFRK